jgi:DNA processing protein
VSACGTCLRRSALLALLAHHIARGLSEHRRLPQLLSLGDQELIEALCGRDRAPIEQSLRRFDPDDARRRAAQAKLETVCRHESDFPSALGEAPDGPTMLYLRGRREHLGRFAADPAVAVVGSRRASPYGLEVAHTIARELAACGVVVVSGMALGVDSAAHQGALAGNGLTVAVLAGGADVPYPRSKRTLYRRLASDGLVVSELPPGAPPLRWCFPARNRIMAALGAMTVVVEGADNSGSLITARFAADLGREVGAVPGHVTAPLANGPNGLLADGACVVRSATDVLDVLYGPGSEAALSLDRSTANVDERLQPVLDAVERGRGSPDAIATSPADVPRILAGLTELELMGLIRRGPDGSYVRRA